MRRCSVEAVAHRQIPPELAALAEDDADLAGIRHALLVRRAAEHRERRRRGHEDAGHHLDHGRFAGAVGAEIADGLARLDREADIGNRRNFGVFGGDERLERPEKARKTLVLPEALGNSARFDLDGHGSSSPTPGGTSI